jgi:lipopolysaccharide export LptBFGC system permease protein LptF
MTLSAPAQRCDDSCSQVGSKFLGFGVNAMEQSTTVPITQTAQQETGRLAILLSLPVASIFFSLLVMVLSPFDNDSVNIAKAILIGVASLAGFGGLITGGIVLVVQLAKGKVHVRNALYFVGAWVVSVLVYIAAMVISISG